MTSVTAALAGTYLSPGQRYIHAGDTTWRPAAQITIARLDLDPYGIPRVTFRAADGHEVTAYAAQVEAAVADGHIAPVVGMGQLARC
ncbi:MAG: hypothetical protein M3R06_00755 [Chloroflexota bacterium]|nr:hypothetical protein [Chloroflexota bacterium]